MERVSRLVYSGEAHRAGYTGKGVTAAVIDTGIGLHPDIPSDRIVAFRDFIHLKQQPYDDSGHGTHVCGILGGSGLLDMRMQGIAPDCSFIVLKALNREGDGEPGAVTAALTWILENRQKFAIRVVNLSFGAVCDEDDRDYIRIMNVIHQLWDAGVCVVGSAGNKGPARGSITFPGCCEEVITVGSAEQHMISGMYSGRGPVRSGIMKPDIVAPAGNISSLSSMLLERGERIIRYKKFFGGSSKALWTEEQWKGLLERKLLREQLKAIGYTKKSGTSMSAPIVAGAICLLLQKEPELSPEEVRLRLCRSATSQGRPKEQQGCGIINLQKLLGC